MHKELILCLNPNDYFPYPTWCITFDPFSPSHPLSHEAATLLISPVFFHQLPAWHEILTRPPRTSRNDRLGLPFHSLRYWLTAAKHGGGYSRTVGPSHFLEACNFTIVLQLLYICQRHSTVRKWDPQILIDFHNNPTVYKITTCGRDIPYQIVKNEYPPFPECLASWNHAFICILFTNGSLVNSVVYRP